MLLLLSNSKVPCGSIIIFKCTTHFKSYWDVCPKAHSLETSQLFFFPQQWGLLNLDFSFRLPMETAGAGYLLKTKVYLKLCCSLKRQKLLITPWAIQQMQAWKQVTESTSRHWVSIPEHLLAVISWLLRVLLGLCLEFEQLELLLLPFVFLHILLHRFVQVGFALGEQTFQRLSGWTPLRHL